MTWGIMYTDDVELGFTPRCDFSITTLATTKATVTSIYTSEGNFKKPQIHKKGTDTFIQ